VTELVEKLGAEAAERHVEAKLSGAALEAPSHETNVSEKLTTRFEIKAERSRGIVVALGFRGPS
jgi:hypothetical protein